MPITRFVRKIYDWSLGLASRPKAPYWLAGLSFAESSFFPIPPDLVLIPMCLSNRSKAVRLALITTIFSVIGGCFGYFLGYFAFEEIAQPILKFYGAMDQYAKLQHWYSSYGELLVLLAGLTPIPYKVFTIMSGALNFNIGSFILYSALSRGTRFFAEAILLYFFGEKAKKFIDKNFNALCWAAGALLIGGFLILKFLMKN